MRSFLLIVFQLFSIVYFANGQNINQLVKDRGLNDVKLGMDFYEIPGIEMLGRWHTEESETPFWKSRRVDEKLEFRNIKLTEIQYGFIHTKLNSIKAWGEPGDSSIIFSVLTDLYGKPELKKLPSELNPYFDHYYYEWKDGKTILKFEVYCQKCNPMFEWTLKGSDKRMKRFLKRFKSVEEEDAYINLIVYTKDMGKKKAKRYLKQLEDENKKKHDSIHSPYR